MAYLLTVTVAPWPVPANRIAPAPPDAPEGRVARVKVDLDSLTWKAIENVSDFKLRFKASEGTVRNELDVDVILLASGAEVLYLKMFRMGPRASIKGRGFADPYKSVNFTGVQKVYGYYCWYWRELAYSEMNSNERMEEVVHICCEKHLMGAAKEEFGNLATPQTIGIVVGIMLVFMATVGGWVAALRAFVGALLAGSGYYVDYQFFKDRHATISSFVNAKSLKPSQAANYADQAGKAMAEMLTKILADFCMAKFGHSMARATGHMRGLFVKRTAADWEAQARQAAPEPAGPTKSTASSEVESKVAAKQQAAAPRRAGPREWMRKYFTEARRGAAGLNVGVKGVRKVKSPDEVNLREGEFAGYKEISQSGSGNCLVLRDPGKHRLRKLQEGVIALSKDIEVVAKSFTKERVGNKLKKFFGYVGISRSDIKEGALEATGQKVRLTDIDPTLPKGEFTVYRLDPRTSDVKGMKSAQESRGVVEDGAVRDVTKAEKQAVREKHGIKALEDTLFVDVGHGKLLIISRGTGMPTISDVDMLAAAQVRNGAVAAGDGISLTGRPSNAKPGDDPQLGRQLNGVMQKNCLKAGHTNMGSYNHFNHSESRGSAGLIDKNGAPLWNPVENGNPPSERLIMFVKGECYVFDDWRSYKAFCSLNDIDKLCPWDF